MQSSLTKHVQVDGRTTPHSAIYQENYDKNEYILASINYSSHIPSLINYSSHISSLKIVNR